MQLGDDIPFEVVGSTDARLWQPDINLLKYTKKPHILLPRDDSRPSADHRIGAATVQTARGGFGLRGFNHLC